MFYGSGIEKCRVFVTVDTDAMQKYNSVILTDIRRL